MPGFLPLSALRTKLWQYRRFALTLFFTIFGSTMVLGVGDAFAHFRRLDYYQNISFVRFLDDLWLILTFRITESGISDVYNHVVSYLFGGILDAPFLYFPFVATVYGYFYAGSILKVLEHFSWRKANYVVFGAVVVLVLLKSLDGVQTVRTWTGLWILVYACLMYHDTREKKYLALMFVPPFVHYAYFAMAIPAWIVLTLGARPVLYSAIFIASMVTTVLPTEPVIQQIAQTEQGERSVRAYTQTEQTEALEQFADLTGQTAWYNAYRRAGLQRWAPTVMALVLIVSGLYSRRLTPYQKKIVSIGILTLTFSNATWFLYALHNRTLTIAMVFLTAGFLLARLSPETQKSFHRLPPYYSWGMNLCVALYVPLIMFNVSLLLDRLSVFGLVLPFVPWLNPEANVSMKLVLNMLLGRA